MMADTATAYDAQQ